MTGRSLSEVKDFRDALLKGECPAEIQLMLKHDCKCYIEKMKGRVKGRPLQYRYPLDKLSDLGLKLAQKILAKRKNRGRPSGRGRGRSNPTNSMRLSLDTRKLLTTYAEKHNLTQEELLSAFAFALDTGEAKCGSKVITVT